MPNRQLNVWVQSSGRRHRMEGKTGKEKKRGMERERNNGK